jgi:hypothetical protein
MTFTRRGAVRLPPREEPIKIGDDGAGSRRDKRVQRILGVGRPSARDVGDREGENVAVGVEGVPDALTP